ncbi:MAG: quinone-dependent dihydroorotate dehydrogenase [Chloroflexi bacterium]|nr:quinone-dependent dihydroorotate dehydrogenase [Chloroflexota bacterium]MCI0577874.1 quinone-dependent dihydroorotate dehydrogenase [Chloroflexota bacterium]MCI0644490.1 quinone-dependent dihydroorotate dehydrogenase [Chloroflexota bacterium]MCI0730242.1 quinone-dependent dihydroorotate dehydrogenase [Chloroflexota bacterium]
MTLYKRIIFPLLRRLDAEQVHERTLAALELAQYTSFGHFLLRRLAGPIPRQPVHLFGLTFPNVLGVAAGFDKDARVAAGLALLGFGHVEAGTLTPQPQPGNPRPRLFRLPEDGALLNRMGFPNEGVAAAAPRLAKLAQAGRTFVLGISLGKQKETPLAEAADDYLAVMRAVYPYADYLAINVSSPNTPGLRELQGGAYLDQLLADLAAENQALAETMAPRPLLLKIAPDLSWPELDDILAAAERRQISGIVATNTTTGRAGLRSPLREETGGLSGRPLATRSNEVIAYIHRQTRGRLPIIGVGGVFTAADAQARLDAGAALVQVYTGLVYEGPGMAGRILRGLAVR